MQLRKLLQTDEERAVSPVIGVILMVAITVILAAVIASFVLGLGDSQEVSPTANFDFDYNSTAELVEVTHTNGDNIQQSQLFVRGSDHVLNNSEDVGSENEWEGEASATIDGNDAITAGDSATVDVSDGSNANAYTVRVVWEASTSDTSSELSSSSGPAA